MAEPKRVGSFQQASDGRSWHEYHGVGQVKQDGSCEFDDETEHGKHSHAVHVNERISYHRHEGAYDACDDDDCDYSNYGRYRHGYRRPSRFSGDCGTWF